MVVNACVSALFHLGEIERASALAERLYEYFPIWAVSGISNALIERGEYARALTLLNEHLAYNLEPNPTRARDTVLIYLLNELYDDACNVALQATTFESNDVVSWVLYANALGHRGQAREANEAWSRARQIFPSLSLRRWTRGWAIQFRNPAALEALTDGLTKAGIS